MKNKLCPFSFAFYIKQPAALSIPPGVTRLNINIGFQCLTTKCEMWDEIAHQCIFWTIKHLLEEMAKNK